MKKRWFFIALSMALLTLVVGGGALLAQGSALGGDAARQSIISRVAVILGLDEATVQDAFDQAGREHQDEAIAMRLSRLVENEKITQAEADETSAWFLRRPDAAVHMLRILFLGEETLQHRLDRMVEYGRITQEDADAVMEWYRESPAGLEALDQFRKHRGDHSTDETASERARPFDRQPGDSFSRRGPRQPDASFSRRGPRQDGGGAFSTEVAVERLLNRLVEQGQLTEDEAAEILVWIDQQPEALPNLGRWALLGEGLLRQRLDRMVENGRIDQDDADAVLEWFRDRPAGIQALNQFLGHQGRQSTDRPSIQPSDSGLRPSGQNRGDRFNGPELRQDRPEDSPGNLPPPAPQGSV